MVKPDTLTNEDTIEIMRELAKNSQGRIMTLPIEMANIIEGKQIEKSWKNIDVSVVMNYLASMMET